MAAIDAIPRKPGQTVPRLFATEDNVAPIAVGFEPVKGRELVFFHIGQWPFRKFTILINQPQRLGQERHHHYAVGQYHGFLARGARKRTLARFAVDTGDQPVSRGRRRSQGQRQWPAFDQAALIRQRQINRHQTTRHPGSHSQPGRILPLSPEKRNPRQTRKQKAIHHDQRIPGIQPGQHVDFVNRVECRNGPDHPKRICHPRQCTQAKDRQRNKKPPGKAPPDQPTYTQQTQGNNKERRQVIGMNPRRHKTRAQRKNPRPCIASPLLHGHDPGSHGPQKGKQRQNKMRHEKSRIQGMRRQRGRIKTPASRKKKKGQNPQTLPRPPRKKPRESIKPQAKAQQKHQPDPMKDQGKSLTHRWIPRRQAYHAQTIPPRHVPQKGVERLPQNRPVHFMGKMVESQPVAPIARTHFREIGILVALVIAPLVNAIIRRAQIAPQHGDGTDKKRQYHQHEQNHFPAEIFLKPFHRIWYPAFPRRLSSQIGEHRGQNYPKNPTKNLAKGFILYIK